MDAQFVCLNVHLILASDPGRLLISCEGVVWISCYEISCVGVVWIGCYDIQRSRNVAY